jgi:hypothetical protein
MRYDDESLDAVTTKGDRTVAAPFGTQVIT